MIVRCPKGHQSRIPDDSPPQTKYRCPICKMRIEVVWAPGVSSPPPADMVVMSEHSSHSTDRYHVSIVAAFISIFLLLMAVFAKWPYGFYTLLRIVVCGSSLYIAFSAATLNKKLWVWIMGATAVLFNPLIPIHLHRSTWQAIDFIAAVVFAVSLAPILGVRTKAALGLMLISGLVRFS